MSTEAAFIILILIAGALGVVETPGGLLSINKGGLIYGDSITVERADKILLATRMQGFHPYNHVFGIGSYTYQYVTRDTYNIAFKATAVEHEVPLSSEEFAKEPAFGFHTTKRVWDAIYKDPVTDNAHKKSHRGIPLALWKDNGKDLYVFETLQPHLLDHCAFRKVFNGDLLVDQTLEEIRARVHTRAFVDVVKH